MKIKDWFGSICPLMIEFRNQSWHEEDLLLFLKEQELGFVNVDEPGLKGLMPTTAYVTNKIGYIRFHGRNETDWYKPNSEPWERYNYTYTKNELQEWIPSIETMRQKAEKIFIFFNNHWQSQAVNNAYDLSELLQQPLKQRPDTQPGQPPYQEKLFD